MIIKYFAHASFLIRTTDGTNIVIDPWLDDNPLSKVKSNEIQADYVILSHGHFDHCADVLKIAGKDSTIIAVPELLDFFADSQCKKHPLQIGGAFDFPFGRVKLTSAEHGSKTPDGSYAGLAAGIILDIDGICIYHMGDTGIFSDLKLIGQMNNIDYLLIPIGGNYTMDPSDAALACSWLKPRLAIPMHYNTFPLIKQDPTHFANLCKTHGIPVKIMNPSDEITLSKP